MKTNLLMALVAMFALANTQPLCAADAKAPAKEEEAEVKTGPTEAQKAKARKAKRPVYTKIVDAQKACEMCDQPMFAFLLTDDQRSGFIAQKLLPNKFFQKELAKDNFIVFRMKQLKRDSKNPKKVDTKGLKDPEYKFLENFGTDPKAVARAKRENKDEPKFDDVVNYPAIICISPDGQKELFRLPPYDTDGGLGVWITTIVDLVKEKGGEPVISPVIQKILDNPDDPKKWKK